MRCTLLSPLLFYALFLEGAEHMHSCDQLSLLWRSQVVSDSWEFSPDAERAGVGGAKVLTRPLREKECVPVEKGLFHSSEF